MRLLIIGDIVGRPGKHVCSQLVPHLIRERGLDGVIANSENISAGSGMTPATFTKLRHYGIDVCTMGDHVYKRREIIPFLGQTDRIVRPANFAPEAAGRDHTIVELANGARLAVCCVLGRTFMNSRADCPFHAIERVLGNLPNDVKHIVVDVHAETTSEKVAIGWHFDGRVTAIVGTHTHMPTADACILPKGTAYITDLGMTGPYDSVLGRDKHAVIRSLVSSMPHPYNVAEHDARLSGVIVECDRDSGRAATIEFLHIDENGHDALARDRTATP
jgi:2',3'-cyclic-nucleotide 2'-phosphodiesterase